MAVFDTLLEAEIGARSRYHGNGDGMQAIYPKLRESDLLFLATPVYNSLSGEMQNFMNCCRF